MNVQPLGAQIGASVEGIDLRSIDDERFEEVRELVHQYEMVAFRDQSLSDEDHLAVGRRFGELGVFPAMAAFGLHDPTITRIRDDEQSPPGADYWHTDVTWTEEPPNYALLRCEEIPARGGDTMWASLTAAFASLSPTMQDLVRGLEVRHDCTSFLEGARRKMTDEQWEESQLEEKLRTLHPGVNHPLVRTHPDTGKEALFLGGEFMRHVVGMTAQESEAMLTMLGRTLDDPRVQVRWKWNPGDLVIWDERSTNHRSVADHYPQVRVVCRCEAGKGRPFYRPKAA